MPGRPPHRALRIVLVIISAFAAAGGLLAILAGKPLLVRVFVGPPESEFTTLLLALTKETGGLLLLLSILFFFASRDPARHVAIVDGLIVGLCILAVTPLLSLYTLDLRRFYPGYLIWGRALARLFLALLLYYLRPRQVAGS